MMRRQSVLELDDFARFASRTDWNLLGHSESVNKQLAISNWRLQRRNSQIAIRNYCVAAITNCDWRVAAYPVNDAFRLASCAA